MSPTARGAVDPSLTSLAVPRLAPNPSLQLHCATVTKIAYTNTGQRCGEHHQRAKHSDQVVIAVRDLYQNHAMYPVEIARHLGVAYTWVKGVVYRTRRVAIVDHYESCDETGSPMSLAPGSARVVANGPSGRSGDSKMGKDENKEKFHG